MPHTFFPVPGFLLDNGEPLREAFLMVDAAADWCSAEPRCRGFTLSAEVQDDRLLWISFSASERHVLSSEWMSHIKDPEQRFAYLFSPGYLTDPLHLERTTLPSAKRFCDAELSPTKTTRRRAAARRESVSARAHTSSSVCGRAEHSCTILAVHLERARSS